MSRDERNQRRLLIGGADFGAADWIRSWLRSASIDTDQCEARFLDALVAGRYHGFIISLFWPTASSGESIARTALRRGVDLTRCVILLPQSMGDADSYRREFFACANYVYPDEKTELKAHVLAWFGLRVDDV